MNEEEQSVIDVAETAMKSGLRLSFEYDGEPRLVEVHAIGVSTAGKPCIRAFQVSGGSVSGDPHAWKLFSVRKFKAPKIIDIKSEAPREGYQRGDKAMVEIIDEL